MRKSSYRPITPMSKRRKEKSAISFADFKAKCTNTDGKLIKTMRVVSKVKNEYYGQDKLRMLDEEIEKFNTAYKRITEESKNWGVKQKFTSVTPQKLMFPMDTNSTEKYNVDSTKKLDSPNLDIKFPKTPKNVSDVKSLIVSVEKSEYSVIQPRYRKW